MINYNLIACVDDSFGIGYKDELLYNVDLHYFKEKTMDKIVIMGRKTADSIIKMNGKLLPNRTKIILTRNKDYSLDHLNDDRIFIYNSTEEMFFGLNLVSNKNHNQGTVEEVFVIGGEEIYRLFLPHANKLYLTQVFDNSKKVDSYFPDFNSEEFKLVDTSKPESSDSSIRYEFNIYQRVSKQSEKE